jgi:hypothetical protein
VLSRCSAEAVTQLQQRIRVRVAKRETNQVTDPADLKLVISYLLLEVPLAWLKRGIVGDFQRMNLGNR